jgi:hypothetical protein
LAKSGANFELFWVKTEQTLIIIGSKNIGEKKIDAIGGIVLW